MNTAEKIRSNVEAHGFLWALAHARKAGINDSTVSYALFGRYDVPLNAVSYLG